MNNDLKTLVGQELAGFQLTSLLGEGGMAAVFRGENVLNPSIVRAIKVVRPELASRPEFGKRFSEEAMILEKLSHPSIVRFFGIRTDRRGADTYLVMELELLEGQSIATALQNSLGVKTPLRDVVSWVQRACEGVAVAHGLGVVHRDLKPDNLYLTKSAEIKVLDFGIARVIDDMDRANKLTVAGTVPGSPPYMAPEVCSGSVPSAAADVYALGITLYEVLWGYHPFAPPGEPSKSSTQLMFAHVNNVLPPLRSKRPDVPELLEQVAARAIAKNPAERFASAREFGDALRAVLERLPGSGSAGVTGQRASMPQTEFALPQFNASPSTTSGAVITTNSTGANLAQNASGGGQSRGMLLAAGAALAVVAGVVGVVVSRRHGDTQPVVATTAASVAPATTPAPDTAPPRAPELNRWIRIAPPASPVTLGLSAGSVVRGAHGFRPTRHVTAPTTAFEIQQHEVTWAEMDAWLAQNASHRFQLPDWVPADANERKNLPATGVPWDVARTYCHAQGGSLPSEEEWEYAARGSDRRPYSWGAQPIDLARTHAFAGSSGRVVEVKSSDQDVTPAEDDDDALYDMMGNALEWTADLYRDDEPNQDESWVQADGTTFRAVRGLPLHAPAPAPLPAEGAAYRDSLCATGQCPPSTAQELQFIGFRCARRVHSGRNGS